MRKRRHFAGVFALVALLLSLTAGVAQAVPQGASAPATAAADRSNHSVDVAPQSVQTFRNGWSNRCLDDSKFGLRTVPCNGLDFQKWSVTPPEKSIKELRNVATGWCLTTLVFGIVGTAPCDGSLRQQWRSTPMGNGTIHLWSIYNGDCLDDSEYGLRTFPCGMHWTPYQSWS
jgi:hypothetical protein